jgi:uncharacterized membrane protein
MPSIQGPRRKLLHATLYELIAIAMLAALAQCVSTAEPQQALGLAVATSVIAWCWNIAFNALFETWEARQLDRTRTWRRRAAHALAFEAGLAVLTVPLMAWYLNLGWLAAVVADLGLIVLFLVYTFVFNWAFDHAFGPPWVPSRTSEPYTPKP